MQNIFKKTAAVAMIAGAALAVSACGKTENTNISENTTMTDMNAMAPTEGTLNDASANSDNLMGSNTSNTL